MLERLGPYRLIRQLAVGGTAEIWLAEAEAGSVVVKRLLPSLRHHPEAVELFEAEARLARRCAHPHVAAVLDAGADGEERWIAMEYVTGPTLSALAGPQGSPLLARAPAASLRIVLDLLAALDHTHRCGVVHGDVNPYNLVVRPSGDALLLDFGVAGEVYAGDGPLRQARGTWAYMSPEQVRGTAMDGRSDLFAVGVMLWELASGRRLFRRAETWLTMAAVVDEEPPALDDAEVDAICRRALAKDRDVRARTAEELAAAIAELAGRRGIDLARSAVIRLVAANT